MTEEDEQRPTEELPEDVTTTKHVPPPPAPPEWTNTGNMVRHSLTRGEKIREFFLGVGVGLLAIFCGILFMVIGGGAITWIVILLGWAAALVYSFAHKRTYFAFGLVSLLAIPLLLFGACIIVVVGNGGIHFK